MTRGLSWEDLCASGQWLYQVIPNEKGSALEEEAGPVQSSSLDTVTKSGDMEVVGTQVKHWESNGQQFYQYDLTVKNISGQPCQSWAVDVKFNSDISLSDSWNGQYSAEGDTLHISSMDYNGNLSAGGSTGDVGFIVSGAAGLEIQTEE